MLKDLKVVFMGTPNFGEKALEYLIENTNVVLVVSQPDKMVGRKKEILFSDIKKCALKHNIEVFQPFKIKEDFSRIKEVDPDIIITAAYGQIISKELLDVPRLGCLNLHGSILPFYRGAAPIQESLLNGDKETGVSLMYMDEAMDTGDVIDIERINIDEEDNFETLYEKLSVVAKNLTEKNIESIYLEKNSRTKQDDNIATYTKMIKREDELLDFTKDSLTIFNKVRGLYPNASIVLNNQEIKVLKCSYVIKKNQGGGFIFLDKSRFSISTSDGFIDLEIVKPSGKNAMPIKNYINGLDKNKINGMQINS